MSNTIRGGRSIDLNVQAGEGLKVSTITGTYTATVLAGAGAGTALATESSGGATYGPYAAGVVIRVKCSADGLADIDVGVSPALNYAEPARFGYGLDGDVSSLVAGAGNPLSDLQLVSGQRQSSGTVMIDWDNVTIGTPTAGWTVTKDTADTFAGKTTLSITASAGAADTMTCALTVPATFLGGAKRVAFAVKPGDSYYAGSDAYPVQLWFALSGSTTHRMTGYGWPAHAPGDWAEAVLFDQDASGSGHITGTTQWTKFGAEEFTSITLVMTKRAGEAVTLPLKIGPVFTDPVHPATLTVFLDGQYSGQYKYARQILKAYGIKTSMGILPYWINDYPTPGAGAFPNTMTQAQMLAMYDLGHEFIHHTGTAGPAGDVNVGWDNANKYPDVSVYAGVLADVTASQDWMRSVGAMRGLGYGVVGFSNGLSALQALARRQSIAAALRAAGIKKIRATGSYLSSYYGGANTDDLVSTQCRIATAADASATLTGIIDQIIARGGWSGLVIHNVALSGATGNDINVDTLETVAAHIATKVEARSLRTQLYSVAMRELSAVGAPR